MIRREQTQFLISRETMAAVTLEAGCCHHFYGVPDGSVRGSSFEIPAVWF